MLRFLPGARFPAVSIAGGCSLMCEHCQGRYLDGMKVAEDPDDLLLFGTELAERGGRGMLISGGFDRQGRLGIGPFLPAIEQLSDETDLVINMHPGLLDGEDAANIASAGVDVVSIDLIGDAVTVREIYHLDKGPSDYLESGLRAMDAGLEVVPHVTMGLHRGRLKGEMRAVSMAVEMGVNALVMNALIGGTVPGLSEPPVGLMRWTRNAFPGRIVLGCMYPRGRGFVESAERAGFDGVVAPGMDSIPGCCALAARDEWLVRIGGQP